MNINMEELSRIAAEQHREFMAAAAIESDLELAYRLQLEEAMAASLTIQPPQPIPNLQTLEIDKLQNELKHRLVIETETETKNITKSPYGEGSSSSSLKSEDDEEVYMVYFKGLWSEERVYGPCSSNNSSYKTVTVAGMGAEICDSTDEGIYEMKKPLKLIEGEPISRPCVEGQALVETLKGAAALGLKRIQVFCDFYLLYEFVTGKLLPDQQKCIDIMDQVNLLRKSFTYCKFSLILRDDVKHVFRLAREAINSQISKLETKTKSPYKEGSSSSSSSSKSEEDDGEVYRIHFKGLWSDERVYGPGSSNNSSYKIVTLAGVGSAIYDSTDEVIYEMKKPLKLIEGERVSRPCVEGQALVATLKGAAALGLQRIEVFVDFYLLYEFVS
ncbi:putative ribonuclease H domain, E3 ubiquitin ligase RBR family, ribonuclease H superfamily [Helianthus annuus]|nr:putative ribonuclease H domain, E3 ubiquitin ligase RBR family, ribonuclease H superfamily [Helianthus annuus]